MNEQVNLWNDHSEEKEKIQEIENNEFNKKAQNIKGSIVELTAQIENIRKNRIKRLILNLLLDIRKEDINKKSEIEYVRLLAMNDRGRSLIKSLKDKHFPIFVNWKDIEKNVLSHKIKIEKNAFLLYELLKKDKEKLNVVYLKGEN